MRLTRSFHRAVSHFCFWFGVMQLVATTTAAGHMETARTVKMLLSTMVLISRALLRTVAMGFLYGTIIAVNGNTPSQLRIGVQIAMAAFQYLSILGESAQHDCCTCDCFSSRGHIRCLHCLSPVMALCASSIFSRQSTHVNSWFVSQLSSYVTTQEWHHISRRRHSEWYLYTL